MLMRCRQGAARPVRAISIQRCDGWGDLCRRSPPDSCSLRSHAIAGDIKAAAYNGEIFVFVLGDFIIGMGR